MKKIKIDFSQVEAGPIRHQWLDPTLVARIAVVRQAVIDEGLGDMVGQTLTDWVDDFRRDMHPEIEVAAWEQTVSDYRSHCLRHPTLSDAEKRNAFGRLLIRGPNFVIERE